MFLLWYSVKYTASQVKEACQRVVRLTFQFVVTHENKSKLTPRKHILEYGTFYKTPDLISSSRQYHIPQKVGPVQNGKCLSNKCNVSTLIKSCFPRKPHNINVFVITGKIKSNLICIGY